jgi:hypothetical protein
MNKVKVNWSRLPWREQDKKSSADIKIQERERIYLLINGDLF